MKLEYLFKNNLFQSVNRLPEWLRKTKDYSWQIHTLRTTLGMTQEQLGRRASQDGRLIRLLESGKGDPQLSTLKKTANGLECDLIIRFVPRKPILKLMRERAEKKAKQIIQLSKGSAALEEQEPEEKYIKHQIKERVEELIDKKPSLLWED
jgi:predicted DNA-binding mobile mystery protein A